MSLMVATFAREVQPAAMAAGGCPFDLEDDAAYRRWRAWKLAHRARDLGDLVVELRDPRAMSAAERGALTTRIAHHGAAVYRSLHRDADPELPRALGAQLGLVRLHANWLAGEDGISHIEVAPARGESPTQPRAEFIPYTERAIGWHTDGYYQPAHERILGMLLHCVRPAREGGETSTLDPELVYIALRDASPDHVRAFMHPRALEIPAREAAGGAVERAAETGPVFSLVPARRGGRHLHMRYTARTRSIRWRDDAATRAALACLNTLLAPGAADVRRFTLEAGMGLVGHNVLHARTAFSDDAASPRLLYRARYLDRIEPAEEDAWRA
jgi:alpha-ketoglutarate-dependent taurine dioxygenase